MMHVIGGSGVSNGFGSSLYGSSGGIDLLLCNTLPLFSECFLFFIQCHFLSLWVIMPNLLFICINAQLDSSCFLTRCTVIADYPVGTHGFDTLNTERCVFWFWFVNDPCLFFLISFACTTGLINVLFCPCARYVGEELVEFDNL